MSLQHLFLLGSEVPWVASHAADAREARVWGAQPGPRREASVQGCSVSGNRSYGRFSSRVSTAGLPPCVDTGEA